jgi:hypothetical protein
MEKQDDNLDDKVTNSEQENDSSKKKEIYMTSVGRISNQKKIFPNQMIDIHQ